MNREITEGPADTPPVLKIEKLSVKYLGKSRESLRSVSVSVPQGSKFAVLGYSGSGKSTLLSILGGLRTFRSCAKVQGHVNVKEPNSRSYKDVLTLKGNQIDRFRSDSLGFVLPKSPLLSNLDCLHNLTIPLLLQKIGRKQSTQKVKDLVDELDEIFFSKLPDSDSSSDQRLSTLLKKFPHELSSGQRQRIAVVRSFVHDPRILLADEPFSNLDPVNHKSMLELLSKWQDTSTRKPTIVLVSHHWETAFKWADFILVLFNGESMGVHSRKSVSLEEIKSLVNGRYQKEVAGETV